MNDSLYILDASALLALMLGEPGYQGIQTLLPQARISAVNLSEVVAKLQERGVPDAVISETLADLELTIIPFDRDQAIHAGLLRRSTRTAGLSLGDRSCLAAAAATSAIAVTTDRLWSELELDVRVQLVR